MGIELPSVYQPEEVEQKIYQFWLEGGFFTAPRREDKETFTIVIPPPNVTGSLHMGHALNNTIQDVLIRWRRMQGYDTLWLPGTDHAGIATQNKVEEHILAEGKNRHQLGREKFLERAWAWKEEYHERILNQLFKLGVSCDWSRERFTMDDGCSRAVREVFVSLYEQGLIYRGDYMINWCTRCNTALSDIEVEHEDKDSTLTHIRYPGVGWDGHIVVATTRPETMLGDTAVAVHPEDERYSNLIGKTVLLPLMEREIPIIADDYVDPSFGSGAVKITPAHDPNDFEIGLRHSLERIKAIAEDGAMTEETGKFAGLERFEARQKVVEDLKKEGLLEEIEEYTHSVGLCQRCAKEVEPLISLQWFVRMQPLAEPAIDVVKAGKVRYVPERFTRMYLNWMENIRDWCISRQIWWGHRIPAWYCGCGEFIVSRQDPTSCPACGSSQLEQDPDVLDTWFSSALWPFSTLGWPEETPDLKHYFPTDVLVTGYDIITFWVARMIFMSLNFMNEIPFSDVCIHGLVRDAQGRKMSKSLGNGVDPLEVIDQYGSDTLRFTLITGQAPGNDQRFRHENVEASRNFANKIWNASRYVLMNLQDYRPGPLEIELNRHDRWILDRFNATVEETNRLLEKYELGEAARCVYEFLWGDYCDWYIELSKIPMFDQDDVEKERVRAVLHFILEKTLRLLHPFMPFITEEIWQNLPRNGEEKALVVAPWPEAQPNLVDEAARQEMDQVMGVIRAVRNLRSEMNIPPGQKSAIIVRAPEKERELLSQERAIMERLSWAEPVEIRDLQEEKPSKALTALVGSIEVYLPLEGVVDFNQELARLEKNIQELEKDLEKVSAKLVNNNFLERAPEEVVEKERSKEQELKIQRDKLTARLEELKKMT